MKDYWEIGDIVRHPSSNPDDGLAMVTARAPKWMGWVELKLLNGRRGVQHAQSLSKATSLEALRWRLSETS